MEYYYKINFSQPGGVNVILHTMRQIDATQNKAVPDNPYARLFNAAPSCYYTTPTILYIPETLDSKNDFIKLLIRRY